MKTCAGAVLSGIVAFVSSQVLLQWQYPWSTYYGNFHFGRGVTLASYLLVSLVLAVIAAAATVISLRACKANILAGTLLCGLTVFVVSALWAIAMGVGGLEVPGLHLNGIFFCEAGFLGFIFLVAAPVSLIAAAVCWRLERKQAGVRND